MHQTPFVVTYDSLHTSDAVFVFTQDHGTVLHFTAKSGNVQVMNTLLETRSVNIDVTNDVSTCVINIMTNTNLFLL